MDMIMLSANRVFSLGYSTSGIALFFLTESPFCKKKNVSNYHKLHFAGNLDIVFCFYCGQGLQDWKDDDIPWCEHARWSSDCPFLLNIKGQEFVRLEQLKQNDPAQVKRERER